MQSLCSSNVMMERRDADTRLLLFSSAPNFPAFFWLIKIWINLFAFSQIIKNDIKGWNIHIIILRIYRMDTYNRIQAITSLGERRKAIKALSESPKKDYTNYQSNLRKKKVYERCQQPWQGVCCKQRIQRKGRKQNPEKVRAIVREYVRKFRERQAAKNSNTLSP